MRRLAAEAMVELPVGAVAFRPSNPTNLFRVSHLGDPTGARVRARKKGW
jgi:hypothetical protein